MNLRSKLVWLIAISMFVVLVGIGVTLFWYLRQDMRRDFQSDLERLATAYAKALIFDNPTRLQPLPESPVPEEIENPQVYLLGQDGQLLDALSSATLPSIPAPALQAAFNGQVNGFELPSPEVRPLWMMAFSLQPLPLERRGVLLPLKQMGKRLVVFVHANDLGLVRVLDRVRASIALWALIGFAVVLVLAIWLSQVVTRPLQDISHAAVAIGQGELSARIANATGNDEIARLKQQLNAMLEQLQTLVESQRRFTADAAHDLRTPLAVIRGELEITLRKPRSAEGYREALERLQLEVKRFSVLAEDMLLLSKLEAGQQSAAKRLNVLQALEPILTANSVAARQHGVVFQVHIPPRLEVMGEASALARAVGNLLSNALNHGLRGLATPAALISAEYKDTHHLKRPEFGLEVTRHSNLVQFRVFNSGEAIPTDQREGLFARFRKGEHSSGSGLGLAIVQQIAQQHNGRIFYEPRVGGGSVFVLEIPA
jgi:two-component system, OmpR family, sensor kinase